MRYHVLRRLFIRLRWRKWVGPVICAIPYFGSIVWLFHFSQAWIAITMLIPAVLIIIIGVLTWSLARIEFYGSLNRR